MDKNKNDKEVEKKVTDENIEEEDEIESDEYLDALFEKYARLEEQHDQWNREYHDDDESLRIADEFAEKIGLRVVEISEKGEGEDGRKRK